MVIPVYREQLNPSEVASLVQVRKILGGKYDICFMAPRRMRSFLQGKGYSAKYWPDEYFADVRAYSRLLLTENFYECFADYEYMLLYQLDAFVFADRLEEFCSLCYDYIGAPMPYWSSWRNMPTRVGNGGFSLRRIEACRRVVSVKAEIYARTGRGEEFEITEDKFFGYCGADARIDFSIPDTEKALRFSVEFDVRGAWKKLSGDNLPFGCHAWSKKHYFALWKPYLKKFVPNLFSIEHEIAGKQGMSYRQMRKYSLEEYLFERICRKANAHRRKRVLDLLFPASKEYFLWGAGEVGMKALRQCKEIGLRIVAVLDSFQRNMAADDIPVIYPDEDLLRKRRPYIIVAVTKPPYVAEILSRLRAAELLKDKDYMLYPNWIHAVSSAAYGRIDGGN